MNSVVLKNSNIVVYTKEILAGTITPVEYGLVCAFGSTNGVSFSTDNCGVKFSSFGDPENTVQVKYLYTIDSEGKFTLTLDESEGQ
jgi:hypothetical protein